jgi:recombination protein RecA
MELIRSSARERKGSAFSLALTQATWLQPVLAPAKVTLLQPSVPVQPARSPWCLEELLGRITELVGGAGSAGLTLASRWVVEAQRQGEPVAWLTSTQGSFFPPDLAEAGVELSELTVVRSDQGEVALARAADRLVRSGGFGLVVIDWTDARAVALEEAARLVSRLAGLARTHQVAVLCLTQPLQAESPLGSMVSLRVQAARAEQEADCAAEEPLWPCQLRVLKDRRRGPSWGHRELFRGPAGLR